MSYIIFVCVVSNPLFILFLLHFIFVFFVAIGPFPFQHSQGPFQAYFQAQLRSAELPTAGPNSSNSSSKIPLHLQCRKGIVFFSSKRVVSSYNCSHARHPTRVPYCLHQQFTTPSTLMPIHTSYDNTFSLPAMTETSLTPFALRPLLFSNG